MKLTKETLKQIIKEELEAVMDEGFENEPPIEARDFLMQSPSGEPDPSPNKCDNYPGYVRRYLKGYGGRLGQWVCVSKGRLERSEHSPDASFE